MLFRSHLTRQKGKWRYIVWDWGVSWGAPMAFGSAFAHPPNQNSWFYSETSKYPILWLIFLLILGVLIASLCGLFLWSFNERKLKKILEDDTTMNKTSESDHINPSRIVNTQETESVVLTNILKK